MVAVRLCCLPFLCQKDAAGVVGFPDLILPAQSPVVGLDSELQVVQMVSVTGLVGELEWVCTSTTGVFGCCLVGLSKYGPSSRRVDGPSCRGS